MNGKYDDIIEMKWQGELSRPRMAMAQRAKIFLPFAALKGYEEALEEKRLLSLKEAELVYAAVDDQEWLSD